MSNSEHKDGDDKREVFSARDRFSGALSSAVDKVECGKSDGEGGQTYFLGSPVKRHLNLDSPWNSPTKSPRSARRRRKKEQPVDSAFHHTFVMKLFDRSLDLAQFPENTALYPVCRAWMKNQPHNTNMAPRIRTPTPEPPPVDDEVKDDAKSNELDENKDLMKNEDNSQENGMGEPEAKKPKIYKLPPCVPLEVDENGHELRIRIPKPLSPQKSADIDISKSMTDPPATDSLLNEHMERWGQVRRRWKTAFAANEARYSDSLNLLKAMFEN